MKKKKIIPYILIALFIFSAVLAPLGVHVAFADPTTYAVPGNKIPTPPPNNNGICGPFSLLDCFTALLAAIGNAVLTIFSKILVIAGAILNFSVGLTINMGDFLAKVKIVEVGWTVARDMANLFFIFVLLWLGIRFILGLAGGEGKKTLMMVIIMALLINFSLFITKAVVDAGNIAALHFYNAMRPDLIENGKVVGKAGLSDIYMEALKLQTLMAPSGDTADAVAEAGGVVHQAMKIFIATVLGSVFFIVAAFIFIAAALFFITRAVVLMLIMLTAPLAFVAQILPNSEAQGLAKKWWHTLFSQTFFAPLYMMLTYAVARAIQSGGFKDLLNITNNQASFAALLQSNVSDNVGIVVNYIIVIVVMCATLYIAKSAGAVGAATVIKWGKALQGVGTGMVGGLAAQGIGALAKTATAGLQGSTSSIGRAALRTADRLQNIKIGGGKSYKERQEKGTFFQVGEEEIERNMKSMRSRPQEQAQYLSRLSEGQRRKAYEKLSARDRVALERSGVLPQTHIDDMFGRLNPEEQDKVNEARRKARQEEGNEQRMTTVETIATVPVGTSLSAEQIQAITQLHPNQARDLSTAARTNPEIIRRLRPQHLRDLMENGNLLPAEITAIMNEITGATAYPQQAAQLAYVSNQANAILWT